MNTVVIIKSCSAESAKGKIDYIEQETKADKTIIVIEKNDIIETKKAMTDEEQKEIRKAQKDLSCYTKRLNEAIKLDKKKSIKTNQENIEKAKEILQKYENRVDKREKHFVEFTVALTNAQNSIYAEDWQKQTLAYFKKQYPDLKVVSAVEHRGQHSPHMHIIMQSTDKPVPKILRSKLKNREAIKDYSQDRENAKENAKEKARIEKLEERAVMREVYRAVQHDYHSFANENFAENKLDKLNKERNYVSIGKFKEEGNINAKLADENRKSNNIILSNQGANNERNEQRKSRKKRSRNKRQLMLYLQEQNEIRNLGRIQDTMAVRRDWNNNTRHESRDTTQSEYGERRVFSENEKRELYNNKLQQVRETGLEQKAIREVKGTIEELDAEYNNLSELRDKINQKLSNRYEDNIRINIIDKESTWFRKKHSFVAIEELKRAKESAIETTNKYEELGIDTEKEKKDVIDSFNGLLELKHTKERLSKGAEKEEVIIVDKDKMSDWIDTINNIFGDLRKKLDDTGKTVFQKMLKLIDKIEKHPERIKEMKERERKLAEEESREKQQEQPKEQQEKDKQPSTSTIRKMR